MVTFGQDLVFCGHKKGAINDVWKLFWLHQERSFPFLVKLKRPNIFHVLVGGDGLATRETVRGWIALPVVMVSSFASAALLNLALQDELLALMAKTELIHDLFVDDKFGVGIQNFKIWLNSHLGFVNLSAF